MQSLGVTPTVPIMLSSEIVMGWNRAHLQSCMSFTARNASSVRSIATAVLEYLLWRLRLAPVPSSESSALITASNFCDKLELRGLYLVIGVPAPVV